MLLIKTLGLRRSVAAADTAYFIPLLTMRTSARIHDRTKWLGGSHVCVS